MIPNNARQLRITAAAVTKLAVTSSGADQFAEAYFLTPESSLHPVGLPPTRGVAASDFRPLRNIRYCSPPWRSGQCLSPDVAGQPLSPATINSRTTSTMLNCSRPPFFHRMTLSALPQDSSGLSYPPFAYRLWALFLCSLHSQRIYRTEMLLTAATLRPLCDFEFK